MKKLKWAVIFSFSLALIIVLVRQDWGVIQSADLLRCPECEAIPVTRVIDGDTFVSGDTRVRLYGMDAPEIGEPCADEATDRLKDLAGSMVRVEPGTRAIDQYGRTLAYLYTESGASIDELLISEGLAVAWTRDGQHRLASHGARARGEATGYRLSVVATNGEPRSRG